MRNWDDKKPTGGGVTIRNAVISIGYGSNRKNEVKILSPKYKSKNPISISKDETAGVDLKLEQDADANFASFTKSP